MSTRSIARIFRYGDENSYWSFPISSETTIAELAVALCTKLEAADASYEIYEVKGKKERLLRPSELVMEVIARWKSPDAYKLAAKQTPGNSAPPLSARSHIAAEHAQLKRDLQNARLRLQELQESTQAKVAKITKLKQQLEQERSWRSEMEDTHSREKAALSTELKQALQRAEEATSFARDKEAKISRLEYALQEAQRVIAQLSEKNEELLEKSKTEEQAREQAQATVHHVEELRKKFEEESGVRVAKTVKEAVSQKEQERKALEERLNQEKLAREAAEKKFAELKRDFDALEEEVLSLRSRLAEEQEAREQAERHASEKSAEQNLREQLADEQQRCARAVQEVQQLKSQLDSVLQQLEGERLRNERLAEQVRRLEQREAVLHEEVARLKKEAEVFDERLRLVTDGIGEFKRDVVRNRQRQLMSEQEWTELESQRQLQLELMAIHAKGEESKKRFEKELEAEKRRLEWELLALKKKYIHLVSKPSRLSFSTTAQSVFGEEPTAFTDGQHTLRVAL